MKKVFIIFIVLLMMNRTASAQSDSTFFCQEIQSIQMMQKELECKIAELERENSANESRIEGLRVSNDRLQTELDSVAQECSRLSRVQTADRDTLSSRIVKTDASVRTNEQTLSMRTTWGIVMLAGLLCIIVAVTVLLVRKFKKGSTTIGEVKKAQEMLENAQSKIQEESVKLDGRLLEIIDKQLSVGKASGSQKTGDGQTDHSLALKVADEIVRIEVNLSRMDNSVRGFRQLSNAVQRIKDNFSANGYEIIDMLGKPYVTGMKAAVTFVTDESLEEGKQIITRIIKPQINYNGQMIQAAQIEVSQAE